MLNKSIEQFYTEDIKNNVIIFLNSNCIKKLVILKDYYKKYYSHTDYRKKFHDLKKILYIRFANSMGLNAQQIQTVKFGYHRCAIVFLYCGKKYVLKINSNFQNSLAYSKDIKNEVQLFKKYNNYECFMKILYYDSDQYSSAIYEAAEKNIKDSIINKIFKLQTKDFLNTIYQYGIFCINNMQSITLESIKLYCKNYNVENTQCELFLTNIYHKIKYEYLILNQYLHIMINEKSGLDCTNPRNWMLARREINGKIEEFIVNVDFGTMPASHIDLKLFN